MIAVEGVLYSIIFFVGIWVFWFVLNGCWIIWYLRFWFLVFLFVYLRFFFLIIVIWNSLILSWSVVVFVSCGGVLLIGKIFIINVYFWDWFGGFILLDNINLILFIIVFVILGLKCL